MEGETAEKETAEEKEEEEEGLKDLHHQMSTAGSSMDYSGLPIMHWEDLSLRIAELEKQEQQRRERAKSGTGPELRTVSGGREEDRQQELWRATWQEDEGDLRRCCITSVTSRFHNHKNLQLCFINDSDSEEEEGADMKVSTATGSNGYHPSGLKQEVAAALRALRDKALAEQKETEVSWTGGEEERRDQWSERRETGGFK
ncbi:uncharacterized protein ACJ7VT_007250 isoform 2-T4 [Polymixia lowei]